MARGTKGISNRQAVIIINVKCADACGGGRSDASTYSNLYDGRLAPAGTYRFWNDCIGHFMTTVETTAVCPDGYRSWPNVADCGSVAMVDASPRPARNSHAKRFVTNGTGRMFILHVQKGGQNVSSQNGRDALLQVVAFTLCGTARRFDVSLTDLHRILVVCIRGFGPPPLAAGDDLNPGGTQTSQKLKRPCTAHCISRAPGYSGGRRPCRPSVFRPTCRSDPNLVRSPRLIAVRRP